jgi:hypothetical protein
MTDHFEEFANSRCHAPRAQNTFGKPTTHTLDQFLNLNPAGGGFFEKYENCRFSHFSGLNSRVLDPTRQPKSAILNPETRFCGLRVG